MADSKIRPVGWRAGGAAPHERSALLIPVFALGTSLSVFFAISYVACILGYLLIPTTIINHAVLSLFLPGFKLLSWPSFFLGLIESFGYGWYVALVFGPIYNFFAAWGR
jgi:hypothetical protein